MIERVTFSQQLDLFEQAERSYEAHKKILSKLLPDADIQHVGSTAVPGSLTKGDLDIQIRVSVEQFNEAAELLASRYETNTGSGGTGSFLAFKDERCQPPLGIQLTVIDSPLDIFWKVRDVLNLHQEYREQYDAIKRKYEGQDMEAYRDAKGVFMEELLSSPAFMSLSSDRPDKSKYFTLQQLADGVYAAIARPGQGAWANAGIVDLGQEVLVFDTFLTPAASRDLRRAAEFVCGSRVRYVINSHKHTDHTIGNQVFADCTIIASSVTRDALMNRKGSFQLEGMLASVAQEMEELSREREGCQDEHVRDCLLLEWEECRAFAEQLPLVKLTLPNLAFERTLDLHGSRRSVRVLAYEGGHSESDAVLFLPEEGILFAADLVFVETHPTLHHPDVDRWISILEELRVLAPNRIVPGHGPVGGGEAIEVMLTYWCTLQAEVAHVVADPVSEQASCQPLCQASVTPSGTPKQYAEWAFAQVYERSLRQISGKG